MLEKKLIISRIIAFLLTKEEVGGMAKEKKQFKQKEKKQEETSEEEY